MQPDKRYDVTFEQLPEQEVAILEDTLIREQRRRVQAGERSWVIEKLLIALWGQVKSQSEGEIESGA